MMTVLCNALQCSIDKHIRQKVSQVREVAAKLRSANVHYSRLKGKCAICKTDVDALNK